MEQSNNMDHAPTSMLFVDNRQWVEYVCPNLPWHMQQEYLDMWRREYPDLAIVTDMPNFHSLVKAGMTWAFPLILGQGTDTSFDFETHELLADLIEEDLAMKYRLPITIFES